MNKLNFVWVGVCVCVLYLLLLQGAMVRTTFLHANFYARHIFQKLKVSQFCLCFPVTDFFEIPAQLGTLYL